MSERIGTISFGTASAARVTFGYTDPRDVITSAQNQAGSPLSTVSSYTYRYDDAGRRKDVVYTGSAFSQQHLFKWGYNTRSELATADRHEGDTPDTPGTLMTPGDYDYAYDPIGNRTESSVDADTVTYTPNSLNQYTSVVASTAWPHYCHDADGNLTLAAKMTTNCATASDATWRYARDGENRLVEAEPMMVDVPTLKKVQYTYDYMGRRVRKLVYGLDDKTLEWLPDPEADLRFVYDRWNVVEVLDGQASNQVVKKYTWGLDLSGQAGNSTTAGIHGAGGIGGLLAVEETAGTHAGSYWFLYDANGNFGQVIKASDQSLAAHYEYDPYGNLLNTPTGYAAANPFRFSTKWMDDETGLYYYGYRCVAIPVLRIQTVIRSRHINQRTGRTPSENAVDAGE